MYIRFCGAKIQIASETDVSLAEKNVSNLEKMHKHTFYGTFICIFGRKICKKLLNRTSSNSLRTGGLPLGDITLFGGKGDADLGDGTAIEAILFCIATLVDLG